MVVVLTRCNLLFYNQRGISFKSVVFDPQEDIYLFIEKTRNRSNVFMMCLGLLFYILALSSTVLACICVLYCACFRIFLFYVFYLHLIIRTKSGQNVRSSIYIKHDQENVINSCTHTLYVINIW